MKDGKLVNAEAASRFAFEILLNGPSFERIALPYVQNLQRLGMEMRVRTVDPAQYQVRTDDFDFDMTVDGFGQSLSPGNEQRDFWTCAEAQKPGSHNLVRHLRPGGRRAGRAGDRRPRPRELIARTRALDRVLLWNHYVIPQWHSRTFRVAYWDKFGRPRAQPALRPARSTPGGSSRRGRARSSRASAKPGRPQALTAMGAYLLRRLLLVVPTLLGIMLINFAIVQFAPGGPVEQMLARDQGQCRQHARPRSPASGRARRARRHRSETRRQRRQPAATAARAAWTRPSSREIEKAFGFDKPWQDRLSDDAGGLCRASTSARASSATSRWST